MSTFKLIGDVKFFLEQKTLAQLGPADIRIDGYQLLRDPGLETPVLISVFTDARADDSDVLPQGTERRRGFYGSAIVGYVIGSKLWLLSRSKLSTLTLRLHEQYLKECLAWMVEDGIADSVQAYAQKSSFSRVDYVVRIVRPNADNVRFRFYINWQYQTAGGIDAVS